MYDVVVVAFIMDFSPDYISDRRGFLLLLSILTVLVLDTQ